jgi:drug/metabolite transporter (DMT)-like permease
MTSLARPAVAATNVPPGKWVALMPYVFVVIWSTGFVVAKFGLPYAPPLTFLLLRFMTVLLVLVPLVLVLRAPWPVGTVGHIAVAGILVQAGYLGGVWAAIKLGLSTQSILLCLLALVSITVGTLYQKRFCARFDLRTGTIIQFTASFLALLPFAILTENLDWTFSSVQWTPRFIGALLWSAFALSIGAIFLLFALIRKSAATSVTSLLYLTPPTTALMAWAMFGEAFSLTAMAGMLLAVIGVAFVVRSR